LPGGSSLCEGMEKGGCTHGIYIYIYIWKNKLLNTHANWDSTCNVKFSNLPDYS